MAKRRFSREEFDQYLKILINQDYPVVKYQDPDSCIADYLNKRKHSQKLVSKKME